MKKNNSWFGIIEIIIWMFIFFLWITAVIMSVSSSIKMTNLNNANMIWLNLSREWVELVRNIRDTNKKLTANYKRINPYDYSLWTFWWDVLNPHFYTIENDIISWTFDIKVTDQSYFNNLEEAHRNGQLEPFRLYRNPITWLYSHDNSWEKTAYFRIIETKLENIEGNYEDFPLVINSIVLYELSWLKKVNLQTILTNW